jgi:hypothetical protein
MASAAPLLLLQEATPVVVEAQGDEKETEDRNTRRLQISIASKTIMQSDRDFG